MSGSFSRIRTVFAKEVTDNIRDRRSVLGAFFYPLLGPALMMVLLFVVGRTFSEQSEEVLELPVIGAEHAFVQLQCHAVLGLGFGEASALVQHRTEIVASDRDLPRGSLRRIAGKPQ